jgi:membrane-associated phospholipid phosphatase
MIEALVNFDGSILMFIQEYIRNPILTPIFTFITHLGDGGMIWILISTLLLIFKQTRKVGLMSICALIGSLLINNLFLKNLLERTRPFDVIQELLPLITKPIDFSFPSGHTGSSFAAACVMYRRMPRSFGIPVIILAVLIGVSRLYLGVHYPSDVLFGAITGVGISYLSEALVNYVGDLRRKRGKKE